MPRKEPKPDQIKNRDNEILKPNVLLETEKAHKDWYAVNTMGKQRTDEDWTKREQKKPKGAKKHSLRKEK